MESFNNFLNEIPGPGIGSIPARDSETRVAAEVDAENEKRAVEDFKDSFDNVQAGTEVLSYGSNSEEIAKLQKVVKLRLTQNNISADLGDTGPNGDGIDGVFGNKLRNAIEKLQDHYGILDDGVVGQQTFLALARNESPLDAEGQPVKPTQLKRQQQDDEIVVDADDDSVADEDDEMFQVASADLLNRGDQLSDTSPAGIISHLASVHADFDDLEFDLNELDSGVILVRNDIGDIAYEFKLRDGSWFGTGQALMYDFNGRPSDASSILTPEIIDLMNSYLN